MSLRGKANQPKGHVVDSLEQLYERKKAVEELIRSLERYEQIATAGGTPSIPN